MDSLTLPDAMELSDYWTFYPPAHVVLRGIGQYLGAWDAPSGKSAPGKHLATEAEIMSAFETFQRSTAH